MSRGRRAQSTEIADMETLKARIRQLPEEAKAKEDAGNDGSYQRIANISLSMTCHPLK